MKQFLKIRLQYFGTPEAGGGGEAAAVEADANQTDAPAAKPNEAGGGDGTQKQNDATAQPKYSEAEFRKFQQDLERLTQERISTALAEHDKKSKMTAEEKIKYEQEEQLKKLTDRENEIAQRELKADAAILISEAELPSEVLGLVIGKDKDSTVKNIETFKNVFDKAVQAQVEKRLSGSAPPGGNYKETNTDPFLAGFNG